MVTILIGLLTVFSLNLDASQGLTFEDLEPELDEVCAEYKRGTFTADDAQSMIDHITYQLEAYEIQVEELCN